MLVEFSVNEYLLFEHSLNGQLKDFLKTAINFETDRQMDID